MSEGERWRGLFSVCLDAEPPAKQMMINEATGRPAFCTRSTDGEPHMSLFSLITSHLPLALPQPLSSAISSRPRLATPSPIGLRSGAGPRLIPPIGRLQLVHARKRVFLCKLQNGWTSTGLDVIFRSVCGALKHSGKHHLFWPSLENTDTLHVAVVPFSHHYQK